MESTPDNRVGVFEAKTNWSRLIDRVETGETIILTRHGMPVARLVPYEKAENRDQVRAAVDGLLVFRGPKLRQGMTLRKLIDAGRS